MCFGGFSWEKLEAKELEPPWKPESMSIQSNLDASMNRRGAGTFANTAGPVRRGLEQSVLDTFDFDLGADLPSP